MVVALSRHRGLIIALIKLVVVVAAFGFIYHEVFVEKPFDLLRDKLPAYLTPYSIALFCCSLLLVALNWGLEARKWQLLVRPLEDISFSRAFKATLAGISPGLFTPNRVGEFGSRVFFLKKADKAKAVFATIAGSFSQLLVTVLFGCTGVLIYIFLVNPLNFFASVLLVFLCLLASGAMLIIYFNMDLLSGRKFKNSFLQKLMDKLKVLVLFDATFLGRILLMSASRYIIFSVQYWLLLLVFGVDIGFIHSWICISIIFLLQTAIPSVALMELALRGASALAVFSFYTDDHIGITLSAYVLWIINLILPALLGLIFISGLKIEEE